MPGDLMKKRKIAVLGSRSVGMPGNTLIGESSHLNQVTRKIFTRYTVHRESLRRVLLPHNRKHVLEKRQVQRCRIRL
jgi:hypothetical protein